MIAAPFRVPPKHTSTRAIFPTLCSNLRFLSYETLWLEQRSVPDSEDGRL